MNSTPKPRPALFLDRDGTVIHEVGYLSDPTQVELIPQVPDVIRRANETGIAVVIVTNQAGVAKGLYPEERIHAVHAHLSELLAEHGATVDGYYYCPHHPTGEIERYRQACACRKPSPGMLLRAAKEHGLILEQSWMVGDRLSDLEAGFAAGCRTILVRTGYGREVTEIPPAESLRLVGIFDDLPTATSILEWMQQNRTV